MASKVIFLVCLYGIIQSVVLSSQVSNLSDDQIRRIFHRDPSEVPDFKTTTVQTSKNHRSKREVRPVEFEVEDKKVQLTLTPIREQAMSRYIPVYTVETDYNKPPYRSYKKEDVKYDGALYQDPKNMATMYAHYKGNYIYYDGIFGESDSAKIVRSLPEKWWLEPGQEGKESDHVIFNVNENSRSTQTLGQQTEQSEEDRLEEPLDILYPKLLVVVEYNYFKKLGEDVKETLKYLTTFWNAVNLKYSQFTSPKVKIVVTGVIIAKDDTSLEYIYSSRNRSDMSFLFGNHMLLQQGKYFKNEFNKEVDFDNYDATITMSSLNTGAAVGAAYIGAICSPDLNVGYVTDDGSYSGLQTATHELGHLLNIPHDGEGRGQSCQVKTENRETGTIMAPFVAYVQKLVWSECSKRIIHEFAGSKKAECLRNSYRH